MKLNKEMISVRYNEARSISGRLCIDSSASAFHPVYHHHKCLALHHSPRSPAAPCVINSGLSSENNFEAVIGGGDDQFLLLLRAADFFIAACLGQDFLEHFVIVDRLVMVHHEVLDASKLCELDADYIARMSPALLHGNLVGQ